MASPDQPPARGQPIDPRVRMAAERTLLAWIRTSLGLMGFGFVVARFGLFLREIEVASKVSSVHSPGPSLAIGVALVILGMAVNLLAAWRHARLLASLERAEPMPGSLGYVVAVILAVLGGAIVVYLIQIG